MDVNIFLGMGIEMNKKNWFLVIGGLIFITLFFVGIYQYEEYQTKKSLEDEISDIEAELAKLNTGDYTSVQADIASVNKSIFDELTIGQFVNQKFTDQFDMDITNNSSQYISGSLYLETYDENAQFLDTVIIMLPSGGIPPNQTYMHKGYIEEKEKAKIKKYKVTEGTLFYN